jgi:hypothetical protein
MNKETEGRTIVVYDCETKLPALVFVTQNQCSLYCFGHSNVNIMTYVANRGRNEQNVFGRLITFRYANDEQAKLLGDNKHVVIDKRYLKRSSMIIRKTHKVKCHKALKPLVNK